MALHYMFPKEVSVFSHGCHAPLASGQESHHLPPSLVNWPLTTLGAPLLVQLR